MSTNFRLGCWEISRNNGRDTELTSSEFWKAMKGLRYAGLWPRWNGKTLNPPLSTVIPKSQLLTEGNSYSSTSNKQKTQLKNEQKTQIDAFPKKTYIKLLVWYVYSINIF